MFAIRGEVSDSGGVRPRAARPKIFLSRRPVSEPGFQRTWRASG
jgi:hypothetical protein